ncbi:MAG: hypothetical protein U0905_15990 [Pirellulales bacterium]
MNLGVIHILSFGAIVVASFVISFAVASTIRWWRGSWPAVVYATLPLWLAIGFFMLDVFHHRLFVVWHRYQNEAVPQQGCLTYAPDFYRLYATYQMSVEELDRWVMHHPWQLQSADVNVCPHDSERFGLEVSEKSYQTEMAPNGRQLRLYYKSGTLYVSYNSN